MFYTGRPTDFNGQLIISYFVCGESAGELSIANHKGPVARNPEIYLFIGDTSNKKRMSKVVTPFNELCEDSTVHPNGA